MERIPFIDLRTKTPVLLAEQQAQKARNLIDASRDAFGLASRLASYVALPLGDYLSKRWLEKTNNPYLGEITAMDQAINHPGVFALNLCYEWGCTSGAYPYDDGTLLMRTLDWPFPALGENIVVVQQQGSAGEFSNVTWPGISGVYQAMAKGRFAAALNQAPMRRYKTNMVIDWIRNRFRANAQIGLPPAHLLRQVFETAATYAEAKKLLCERPIAVPVIYILSGTQQGEGCVIERLENHYAVRESVNGNGACATNHFESALNGIGSGWQARPIDSHGRVGSACQLSAASFDDNFAWFTYPIGNKYTRLSMVADAARGTMRVIGTAGEKPVTEIFSLTDQ